MVDHGPHIVLVDREHRQRRGNVEHGKAMRRRTQIVARRRHISREAFENLEFDAERTIAGIGDARGDLAKLGGGEAHLPRQRLTMDEGRVMRRRQQTVRRAARVTSMK